MNCIRCTYCGTCLTAVMVFRLDMRKEEGFSVQMLEVQDMLPLQFLL